MPAALMDEKGRVWRVHAQKKEQEETWMQKHPGGSSADTVYADLRLENH